MRIFTEKDKEAVCSAFQTFMKVMNGKTLKVTTIRPFIEKALAEGLTLDELFNKENYSRAGNVINNPDAEQYVDILTDFRILPKSLRDESNWNNAENIKLLATCFHDFFVTINAKGGIYGTAKALNNFQHALMVFGLQPLLDEALIEKAKTTDEGTCFQYIGQILNGFIIPNQDLTDEQAYRRTYKDIDNIADGDEDDNVRPEDVCASPAEEKGDEDFEDKEDDPFFNDVDDKNGDETHVSIINPFEIKKTRLTEIILFLSVDEVAELMKAVPREADKPYSIENLIDDLARGNITPDCESLTAKAAHTKINIELVESYVTCVRMLGMEITEEEAVDHDLLVEDWDVRDDSARKLYKIKEAVFYYIKDMGDDADLHEAIKDLERYYEN